MIIDSHQHVFWHGRDDAGLVADMDACGIDLAWLLSWEIAPWEDNSGFHAVLNPSHSRSDGTHAGIPLGDLILARNRYPHRFILGYCPHPMIGDAAALFESAYHMHHVRVCGEWKFRMLFDDPRCLNLFQKAGELGCPVVLHLDHPFRPNEAGQPTYRPHWYGGTLSNLQRALEACPNTNFIGHAGGFWREISGDADTQTDIRPTGRVQPGGRLISLLNDYPNLYADLSAGSGLNAMKRDPEFTREFLVRFADRLLFGRDYYGNELMNFLRSLELSSTVWNAITCQNARQLTNYGFSQ